MERTVDTANIENLRGAGLMALAMAGFTLNDTCVKLLAQDLPLMQVVALRGAVACLFLLLVGARTGMFRRGLATRGDWGLMGLRGVFELAAAWTFLTALVHMPLASLTAILQALPLAVTLGAALFFAEPVGWKRWAAIGAGFLGVLMIVRPGGDIFSIYSVLGVLTVGLAAGRDLVTRQLSRAVPTFLVTLVSAALVTMMGFALSLPSGWQPVDAGQGALIVLASGFMLVAYLGIIGAMRVGEIGFVAPFRYTGLIVALVAGFAVFDEFPEPLTLIGAAIVVGSGMFSFWRERRLGIQRPKVPPR